MGLRVEERIVAGGEVDALVVHHLVLRGSAGAIGRHLGELVRARFGLPGDAPAWRARLRCTAAFSPAWTGPDEAPRVVRTIEVAGPLGQRRPGDPPTAGRPYVLELHPDEGQPLLAVCAYDLEAGALEGVNAEGLVAVAAPASPAQPLDLDALRGVRQVLDRCATAAEARSALLARARPGRWLVADRHGDAFFLELPASLRPPRCVEAAGRRLEADAPVEDGPLRTLWQGAYDPVERRLQARFFVGGGERRRGASADGVAPGARAAPPPEVPELRFQLG